MPAYPVDIIPPIIAQIRHQARAEALEEAAKVADYVADHFMKAKGVRKRASKIVQSGTLESEGARAVADAIRALSS